MALIPSAAQPKIAAANTSPAWLVGGLTTFGLLLGAVGIGTGDVPRVLRNETVPAAITFSLVILASISVAGAGWLTANETIERVLLRIGAGSLAIAALTTLWTGIESARERPEPVLTAQVVTDQQGNDVVHFDVKDSGLRSGEKMTVLIRALAESDHKLVPTETLYGASLGPDSSGAVDHSGEVPVPPAPANDVELQAWVGKRHTCYAEEAIASTGCTKLHVTRLFEKPQLALAWRDAAHGGAGLGITLSAHDIADHRVVLRVIDAQNNHQLLSAVWPSDGAGSVVEAITAIIPRSTGEVCVAASTTEASPTCSAPPGSGDASVLTDVPPY
jgi:hypothetical protein